MSDGELQALRLAVQRKLKEGRGPYLRPLKAKLLEHIGQRLEAGERAGQIAQSLGLSDQTISQWCAQLRRKAKKPQLRAVKVASEVGAVGRGLTLQGPGGLRVEGLSVEELAALWRKLG